MPNIFYKFSYERIINIEIIKKTILVEVRKAAYVSMQ